MGTSKGYEAPSTPQWGDVKGDITREAKEGRPNSERSQNIIRKYIQASGGANSISNGRGVIGGKSAVNVVRNIGRFASLIDQMGFREAYKFLELGNLEGKNVFEVTNKLIDFFSESSSTIDDVDSRNALTTLLWEYTEGITDDTEVIEDVFDKKFTTSDLKNLFSKFFSYYLYEQFCRVFYERLVTRVGEEQADSFLSGIKEFLVSRVDSFQLEKDIAQVDWTGTEGQKVASEILEETLYIFGGE